MTVHPKEVEVDIEEDVMINGGGDESKNNKEGGIIAKTTTNTPVGAVVAVKKENDNNWWRRSLLGVSNGKNANDNNDNSSTAITTLTNRQEVKVRAETVAAAAEANAAAALVDMSLNDDDDNNTAAAAAADTPLFQRRDENEHDNVIVDFINKQHYADNDNNALKRRTGWWDLNSRSSCASTKYDDTHDYDEDEEVEEENDKTKMLLHGITKNMNYSSTIQESNETDDDDDDDDDEDDDYNCKRYNQARRLSNDEDDDEYKQYYNQQVAVTTTKAPSINNTIITTLHRNELLRLSSTRTNNDPDDNDNSNKQNNTPKQQVAAIAVAAAPSIVTTLHQNELLRLSSTINNDPLLLSDYYDDDGSMIISTTSIDNSEADRIFSPKTKMTIVDDDDNNNNNNNNNNKEKEDYHNRHHQLQQQQYDHSTIFPSKSYDTSSVEGDNSWSLHAGLGGGGGGGEDEDDYHNDNNKHTNVTKVDSELYNDGISLIMDDEYDDDMSSIASSVHSGVLHTSSPPMNGRLTVVDRSNNNNNVGWGRKQSLKSLSSTFNFHSRKSSTTSVMSSAGASMSISSTPIDVGNYGDGCGNSFMSSNIDNAINSSTISSTSRGGGGSGKVWGIGSSFRSASIILKQQVIDISSIMNDSSVIRDNYYHVDDDDSPDEDSYGRSYYVMDVTQADVVKEANDLMTSVNKSTLAMGLEAPFLSVDEVRIFVCRPLCLLLFVFNFLILLHILSPLHLFKNTYGCYYQHYADVSSIKETSLEHWLSNDCTRISHW